MSSYTSMENKPSYSVKVKEKYVYDLVSGLLDKVMSLISLFLPTGPIPPNPSELLGSKMMEDLIKELGEKYDLILFDTPPILAVTDAQILGSHCDGVILVTRSRQTEKKDLVKAKEILDRTNINILGVVLNGVDRLEINYAYYYGG